MNKFIIIDEENEKFIVENYTHYDALSDFFHQEGIEWWNDIRDNKDRVFKVIDGNCITIEFIVEREFEPTYYITEKS